MIGVSFVFVLIGVCCMCILKFVVIVGVDLGCGLVVLMGGGGLVVCSGLFGSLVWDLLKVVMIGFLVGGVFGVVWWFVSC